MADVLYVARETEVAKLVSTRAGTVLVVVLWCASWGLIYIHGAFCFLSGLVGFLGFILVKGSREDAFVFVERRAIVWLPLTRSGVRHNERARLVRRTHKLQEGYRVCEELIAALPEAERLRLPVLQAERDAFRRENIRIGQDIKRLEESWVREDRERVYRKLTA